MTHRTLFQILVELMVLNLVFFNRIVNEWNGLPRESNSIATFYSGFFTLIKHSIWLWLSGGCVAWDAWKWEKMGKIQKALCCGRQPNLQALSFYYVLVGGVSFKRLKKPQKIAEHHTRTYGKLSLFIFLTWYQHFGSKRAKFCVLWSISTDHLNQAECGRYTIPRTVRMVALCSIPFLFVLIPNRDIRNASWGEEDYASWEWLTSCRKYTVLNTCLCLRSSPWSYKFWFWTKFLINRAVVSSNDFKRATMSLDVYFISFFLFCHQTGQWIAQITERTRYCQPRF